MPAYLVVKSGSASKRYTCGRVLAIGRVPDNDVVLDDPKVSRHHALIRMFGDHRHHMVDLGSANGCLVNGQRMIVPAALADGDSIRIGDQELTFRDETPRSQGDSSSDHISTLMTCKATVQDIIVLVADVRDFTVMSGQIDVGLLAQVMGRWFGQVNKIVEMHHGVVDKFIGDAVMARWLAPCDRAEAMVSETLQTACCLHAAVKDINAAFLGLPAPLRIGVGINMGQAMLGNVGASNARDYTAMGDSVNMAFRIEKASKELKKEIVMGADAYKHLPEALRCGRPHTISVKGKDAPLAVFALDCADVPAGRSGGQTDPARNG